VPQHRALEVEHQHDAAGGVVGRPARRQEAPRVLVVAREEALAVPGERHHGAGGEGVAQASVARAGIQREHPTLRRDPAGVGVEVAEPGGREELPLRYAVQEARSAVVAGCCLLAGFGAAMAGSKHQDWS